MNSQDQNTVSSDVNNSLVGNIRISRVNFQRRTAEGSRLLRENFHTVIEEIRPLVEQARTVNQNGISLSTFLNRQTRNEDSPLNVNTRDNIVINIENNHSQIDNNTSQENYLNNIRENSVTIDQTSNNNNQDDTITGVTLRQMPEARALLEIIQRYVPFVLILLAKCLYDHRDVILNFIILFICFSHSNSVVKREASKQNRRSLTSLLMQVLYIIGCILFIGYIFEEEKLFLNLITFPSETQPLNVWNLLWMVGITDFILKLITILVKIFIVALPCQLIPYQKRGKFYLLVEATSQLYRSVVPVQPWLYYLLKSYQGPEKIAAVFLSAAYMISKIGDLVTRSKLFKSALSKSFQNVTLGSSPNKEQLLSAGNQCAICHDDYDSPVLLQCRHIFCEACVSTWFDREQTCPLCRAKVVDDPSWRDGSTTFFIQLF